MSNRELIRTFWRSKFEFIAKDLGLGNNLNQISDEDLAIMRTLQWETSHSKEYRDASEALTKRLQENNANGTNNVGPIQGTSVSHT